MQFQPIHSNYADHRRHPRSAANLIFTPFSIRAFRFSRKICFGNNQFNRNLALWIGYRDFIQVIKEWLAYASWIMRMRIKTLFRKASQRWQPWQPRRGLEKTHGTSWKALYAAEYSSLQLQDTRPIGQGASTACLLLAKEQNRASWLVKTLDGQDCLPKVTPYSTKSQLVADNW